MNLAIIFLDLLMFVIGLALGIFVVSRNIKNRIVQLFGLIVIGMAGWNLTIFLLLADIGPSTLIGRLTFTFGVILLLGLNLFVFHFPFKMRGARWLSWFFIITGVLFAVIPLTPWWLTYVEIVDGMITGDLHPVLFPISTLYYLASYIFAFVVLVVRTLRARGVNRRRLSQVLIGFSLFLFPMLTTNIALPALGDFRFNNLGPAFAIFLIAFLANAIISYRLMDIRWIVGKSLGLSVVAAVVLTLVSTAFLFVSSLISEQYSLLIAALLIAVTFEPITKFVNNFVSKAVNHGRYDAKKATEEVFDIVRTTGEVDDLIAQLLPRFVSYFSLAQVGFVALKSNSSEVVGSKFVGLSEDVLKSMPVLTRMVKSYKYEIVESGELKWRGEYASSAVQKKKDRDYLAQLQKLGIEVVIPLVVEGRLVGLVLFGERRLESALHSSDVAFLNLIRNGIAPAFENAAKFEEIKRLYEELAQLDRVKSEFISVVSHRFRTPLSAIRWNIETVIDSAGKSLDADAKMALSDTQNRTMFLVGTLDRLFDTLAVESGKLKLKKGAFNIKKTAEPLVERYSALCKDRGIKLKAKVTSMKMNADEKRLLSVIDTLLSNACLYTQKGEVNLRIGRKNNQAVIEVQDTGIGIPEKDMGSIYDKFFRSKNAVLTYADGQGIGLYLAKHIVGLHKGKIDIVSKVNEGTTFTVTLPIGVKK